MIHKLKLILLLNFYSTYKVQKYIKMGCTISQVDKEAVERSKMIDKNLKKCKYLNLSLF